ncbi:MAG: 2Fe-2S iron-sulfur cluster-binding protein [Microthrixaceae bacterium]
MSERRRAVLQLTVDGEQVEVPDRGQSLLDLLREDLGNRAPKDGCSPQGQCGCCTVLVDGKPRVACVTPARRVEGRAVTTIDGLPHDDAARWAGAFAATGASQCGFCTPGIICRLEALRLERPDAPHSAVEQSLLAHLCRCTGWRTMLDAWDVAAGDAHPRPAVRTEAAGARATLEGGAPQSVGPDVALGRGGFADDTAPPDALVAVPDGAGGWVTGTTLAEARAKAGKVQGRRTTLDALPPLEVPPGKWAATLRTSWVEPAYLEPDASWCVPGGEPAPTLANGGAFGAKVRTPVMDVARRLADELDRPVRVVLSREDVVRLGPKRPPVAGGANGDGTGVLRVARTPGIASAITSVAPDLHVEEVDVPGPPTSAGARAAGWAEAVVLLAGARGASERVHDPVSGAEAEASIVDGVIKVRVQAGEVLDEVVLRSYCTGAAHMALSWCSSEGLAVDADGEVQDLTIRSFGVLRAVDTPRIEIEVEAADGPARRGSDAVFAAVAAAAWINLDCPPVWPTGARWR